VALQSLKASDVRERLIAAGADPAGKSHKQFTAFIRRESAKWEKVIKAAGIKAA
jgi:tripartite-type tricarboxylate transporter receptor subunit TctC